MSAIAAPAARYEFLGNAVTVRVAPEQTGGRLSVLEMQLMPGDQPPLHVHRDEDEGFVVLDGELTLFQPGREVLLTPGETVLAEHGIPHTYLAGPEGARVLVFSTPGGFAAFTAEVAAIEGMPAPEQLGAIAASHGIDILGPPGARP